MSGCGKSQGEAILNVVALSFHDLKSNIGATLPTVARTCFEGPRLSIPNFTISIGGDEKLGTHETGPRQVCCPAGSHCCLANQDIKQPSCIR